MYHFNYMYFNYMYINKTFLSSFLGGDVCNVDWMGETLVFVVHIHCTFCHELEQLYYNAMATHVLITNTWGQQGEYEPHCRALYH